MSDNQPTDNQIMKDAGNAVDGVINWVDNLSNKGDVGLIANIAITSFTPYNAVKLCKKISDEGVENTTSVEWLSAIISIMATPFPFITGAGKIAQLVIGGGLSVALAGVNAANDGIIKL